MTPRYTRARATGSNTRLDSVAPAPDTRPALVDELYPRLAGGSVEDDDE
jgi:hypothetical protein